DQAVLRYASEGRAVGRRDPHAARGDADARGGSRCRRQPHRAEDGKGDPRADAGRALAQPLGSLAMRLLFAFLLLAALAVLVALLFKLNTGYALFVAPPYRVEISINAFILLAVAGFVALYLVLRLASRIARLPTEVRE